MSDSEEESFTYYGKPLEPYDEDAFPKRRPITVEEQTATDAQGRRRFHGAFTGGFSAGFFNTVGSLEGWRPSDFKSTRSEKAESKTQKPEDFMDDEDVGEFGIAPQTVRATKEYSTTSSKRKKQVYSDGPIPGEPVLHQLLTSGNETIGYLLLKNMGIQDKIQQKDELESGKKVYGCYMPRPSEISSEIDDSNEYQLPEIYKEYLAKPKNNTFGLGYQGLDKSHLNLFQPSNLVVREKNQKKLSISGQAFGVGAFEEDDEDIYVKDDMSRYDFEMSIEKDNKTSSQTSSGNSPEFVRGKDLFVCQEKFPLPTIPPSFTGVYKQKKSRFEPLPDETVEIERKNMNAEIRGKYLGEEVPQTFTVSKNFQKKVEERVPPPVDNNNSSKTKVEDHKKIEKIETKVENKQKSNFIDNLLFDRFVSATQPEDDPSNILEAVKPMETTHGTKEMKDAVKFKMFGPLTRISIDWQPCSILCKRFNVPEPHIDPKISKTKKRATKPLIFEYQQHLEEISLKPGLNLQTNIEEINENDVDKTETMEVEVTSSTVIHDVQTDESKLEDKIQEEPSTSSRSAVVEEKSSLNDVERPLSVDKETIDEGSPPKDETERLDIVKNLDLFRAIFLSSSESEGEEVDDKEKKSKEDDKEKNKKKEELKSVVLSDSLIPKVKSNKQGILADIDFSKINSQKIPEKSSELSEVATSVEHKETDVVNLYGPVLPTQLTKIGGSSNYGYKVNNKGSDSDEWVEKSDKKSKKKNKEKKHKKHKKKHKHQKKER